MICFCIAVELAFQWFGGILSWRQKVLGMGFDLFYLFEYYLA